MNSAAAPHICNADCKAGWDVLVEELINTKYFVAGDPNGQKCIDHVICCLKKYKLVHSGLNVQMPNSSIYSVYDSASWHKQPHCFAKHFGSGV